MNDLAEQTAISQSLADDDPVAQTVRAGLARTPKALPPWLFYDDAGSELFEAITGLPEYYPTRTERAILTDFAQQMLDAAGEDLTVVELGAGSADKTQILLEALLARQDRATFVPVDVSPALPAVAEALREKYPGLSVVPISARFPGELEWLAEVPGRRLVLFLGSSIGNYTPHEAQALLEGVRQGLREGDVFLLGTDLVKSRELLLAAYDDSQGVTAAFNKNMLARINRELGGRFDLDAFQHVVKWNTRERRIEIYLHSQRDQKVAIRDLGMVVRFSQGELLHTENSHKFTVDGVRALMEAAGFECAQTWMDARRWFALTLGRV